MDDGSAGEFKAGFAALAGRPNVGKSTLVNRIMDMELSIVTPKAQTTRNRINAIYTVDHAQIIFQDVPGMHEAAGPLNEAMVNVAKSTLEGADLAVMITVPVTRIPPGDERIIDLIADTGTPALLVINKIDTVPHERVAAAMSRFSRAYPFRDILPVSARRDGAGVDALIAAALELLPSGPPLFPPDDVSDLPVRFFVAELIREQITLLTSQEVPYKAAVLVESFRETDKRSIIHADIHVERPSQKKIIVGKKGSMIKQIGTEARVRIEEFIGRPVYLELFVKVTPAWTRDKRRLTEFGYIAD